MNRNRVVISWVLAIVVTLSLSVYQRMTGPTHPISSSEKVGGKEFKFTFARSHAGEGGQEVKVETDDNEATAELQFKRYPSNDSITKVFMVRYGNSLMAELPHQAPAGKLQYQIFIHSGTTGPIPLTTDPVIIRFRGDVPAWALVLHIIVIFSAMMFSAKACADAFLNGSNIKLYSLLTVITLFIGGFIFGPIVQKYSFDAFWTGWPFGHDLTDNKTAFALIVWAVGYYRIARGGNAKLWAAVAGLTLLAVFLVPHSLLGSELDYTKAPNP